MILTNCAACAAPLAHDAPRCVRCLTRYCCETCLRNHAHRGGHDDEKILTYHVVPGTALSTDLTEGVLPTVQGETVEVTLDPIAINGAGVAIPDVLATNGVVHVIDAVLTPPEGL